MTHVTCRLTAKNRDQLRNPALGNGVWAIFFLCAGLLLGVRRDGGQVRRAAVQFVGDGDVLVRLVVVDRDVAVSARPTRRSHLQRARHQRGPPHLQLVSILRRAVAKSHGQVEFKVARVKDAQSEVEVGRAGRGHIRVVDGHHRHAAVAGRLAGGRHRVERQVARRRRRCRRDLDGQLKVVAKVVDRHAAVGVVLRDRDHAARHARLRPRDRVSRRRFDLD